MKFLRILTFITILSSLFVANSCGLYKKVDQREMPDGASAKARKNIEEGRGAGLGDMLGRRGGNTNYEFSTANPMWRATLETLDFLPLTTVDYSGGMVITDWYSENNSKDALKITIRFLSNEIRADNLKIIIHKKTCAVSDNCSTSLLQSNKIRDELLDTIIKKAALLERDSKKKKKKK
jgi:hypothetical protein